MVAYGETRMRLLQKKVNGEEMTEEEERQLENPDKSLEQQLGLLTEPEEDEELGEDEEEVHVGVTSFHILKTATVEEKEERIRHAEAVNGFLGEFFGLSRVVCEERDDEVKIDMRFDDAEECWFQCKRILDRATIVKNGQDITPLLEEQGNPFIRLEKALLCKDCDRLIDTLIESFALWLSLGGKKSLSETLKLATLNWMETMLNCGQFEMYKSHKERLFT